jgi:hypothetical protein
MRLDLALLFTKFHSFILQTYSFVKQRPKVGECMALQLIVERSNQSIQESFLSLGIGIHFIGSIMSGTALGVPLNSWEIPT